MGRHGLAGIGLAAAVLLGAPGVAAAQSADGGWWDWALVELAERSDPVLRASGDEEPRTLSDILREKMEDARRDAEGRRGDVDGRADTRRDRDDDDDRWERDDDRARGRRGPKFCRNGAGHPVHGRAWCRDKGFGDERGRRDVGWEDRGWEGVILDRPRTERRSTMDQGGLLDILGDVVLGRLDGERRRLGGRDALEGRWVPLRDGGAVLQIRSGSLPVAELTDVDGDGRVDVTLIPRR